MKNQRLVAGVALLIGVAGCGTLTQRTTPMDTLASSHYGVVTGVSAVEPAGSKGLGAGAVIGGVVGGVVGNQVGKGSGNTAATIAGALGGAYVGDKVQRNEERRVVYAVEVRLNSGEYSTLTMADGSFREGDRVELRNGALMHR
ncbi:glycine zipper 2TM domain-containing protein [Chitinimonas naiadis]